MPPPASRRCASWSRARVDVEIGDADDVHAGRAARLGEEHRAELAGADQADGDRPAGGLRVRAAGHADSRAQLSSASEQSHSAQSRWQIATASDSATGRSRAMTKDSSRHSLSIRRAARRRATTARRAFDRGRDVEAVAAPQSPCALHSASAAAPQSGAPFGASGQSSGPATTLVAGRRATAPAASPWRTLGGIARRTGRVAERIARALDAGIRSW